MDETKAERRERKRLNNQKMGVSGKDQGEFYRRAVEKKQKRKPWKRPRGEEDE